MMKTVKKAVCVLMVVLMCLTSAPLQGLVGLELPRLFSTKASALDATGKCGENVTYTYNNKTGEVVISGTGEMYNYGYEDSLFYDSYIKSVVIENGVTSIGDFAFYECSSLTNVTIPDSVISIGGYAFDGTAWYNAQPDGDIYIGKVYYTYKGKMPNNTSITIKNGTKVIADYAFYSCDNLTSVTIPDSVKTIGNSAFCECTGLTSITIPDSVESIGSVAFYYCSSLTSVTIPDSVESIGNHAFYKCSSLTSVTIPDSVIKIGSYAFHDTAWYNAQPDGDVYISKFYYTYKGEMPNNTSIVIKDGTKVIADAAFYSCDNLTSVTIGNSVESIGECAFLKCNSLKDVYYTGTSSQWKAISIGSKNECLTNATIHYNPSSLVLGKTSKITATQTTSAVTLKWNAVPNATGYKIYQKTSKGWQSLGNVTGTSKTVSGLTAGTKYTFAVKAGAVVDGKVIWSDVYTTINTATKTLVPTKLTSYQDTNSITLFWIKSKGATGYRIYYRANTNSSWQTALSSTTDTNYTKSGLKPNQAFQFALRPYIKTDSGIVWSDYTTITASTIPATPTAKVTSPSKGKVTLTWNAVSGATGYQVYYKVGTGSWKLYKTTSKPTTYTFSNLKSGTKYTFAVRAYRTVEMTNFRSGYKAVSVTVK